MVGAYITYVALFGVYTNLYAGHPDWIIVIPGLWLVGRLIAFSEGRVAKGERWTQAMRPGRQLPSRFGCYASRLAYACGRGAGRVFLRLSQLIMTTFSACRPRALLLVGLVAVVVGAAVVASTLPRSSAPSTPRLPASDHYLLPPILGHGARVATDADLSEDNASLWVFGPAQSGTLTVHRLGFTGPTVQDQTSRLRVDAGDRTATFAVSRWSGGTPAAFDMRLQTDGVRVRVRSLDGKSTQLSSGLAHLPAVPGGQREVTIATRKVGTLPDLFVIDHGLSRERVTVSVFSGRTAFRHLEASVKAPLVGLPDSTWALFVERGPGATPDLVAVARQGRSSHAPELHILSGDADYQRFLLQNLIGASPFAPGVIVRPGSALGRPAVYVIDPVRRDLRVYPYASASRQAPPPVSL
jgi:hypothetical protein